MAINDNEAFEYLPIVWTNIKTQAFSIIAFIAPDLLKMASVYKDDKEEVLTVFLEISCFVFKAMEDDKNAFKNFEYDYYPASTYNDILNYILFLKQSIISNLFNFIFFQS